MDTVKMEIPGITIEVPVAEVNFYQRAGYSVVGMPRELIAPPVHPDESPVFEKIEAATSIKDLYSLMDEYPERNEAVEHALNAKGMQLMEAEEKSALVANPEPVAKKPGKK